MKTILSLAALVFAVLAAGGPARADQAKALAVYTLCYDAVQSQRKNPQVVLNRCTAAGDYLVTQLGKQTGDADEYIRYWDAFSTMSAGEVERFNGKQQQGEMHLFAASVEFQAVENNAKDPDLVAHARKGLGVLRDLENQ